MNYLKSVVKTVHEILCERRLEATERSLLAYPVTNLRRVENCLPIVSERKRFKALYCYQWVGMGNILGQGNFVVKLSFLNLAERRT